MIIRNIGFFFNYLLLQLLFTHRLIGNQRYTSHRSGHQYRRQKYCSHQLGSPHHHLHCHHPLLSFTRIFILSHVWEFWTHDRRGTPNNVTVLMYYLLFLLSYSSLIDCVVDLNIKRCQWCVWTSEHLRERRLWGIDFYDLWWIVSCYHSFIFGNGGWWEVKCSSQPNLVSHVICREAIQFSTACILLTFSLWIAAGT